MKREGRGFAFSYHFSSVPRSLIYCERDWVCAVATIPLKTLLFLFLLRGSSIRAKSLWKINFFSSFSSAFCLFCVQIFILSVTVARTGFLACDRVVEGGEATGGFGFCTFARKFFFLLSIVFR